MARRRLAHLAVTPSRFTFPSSSSTIPGMPVLPALYRHSLALLTDLYQLTMAYGYWKLGRAEREAVFHLSFRKNPFAGGFTVACGLHDAVDYLAGLRFQPDYLSYLATLRGNDERPL